MRWWQGASFPLVRNLGHSPGSIAVTRVYFRYGSRTLVHLSYRDRAINQRLQIEKPVCLPPEEDDPFRYGWRYVRRTRPDGSEYVDIVPLSHEDLLYPEEDDFVAQKPPHCRDTAYCHAALTAFHASQADVVVLGDCRVDWGVAGVRPLGPDILVLFGVRQWFQQGTFRIAVEGGQPILVLEIASPSTREHDLQPKMGLYFRAGVQLYVILDRGPQGEDPARLLGYRRGPTGWLPMTPDAQGHLDLAPVRLRLGIENDHPWLYDAATGQRLPDYTELTQTLTDTQVRANAEAEARAAAEARARDEAQARAALEQRLRELEDLLRRPPDPT